MTPIGTVRYRGRAKWTDVFLNLLLVPFGAGFAAVIFTQLPADAYPMHALGWYTLWVTLLCAFLAISHALTRQMPTVQRRIVDGSPASGVRAWRGERIFHVGNDLGIGVVAAALTVMAFIDGGEWVVPSLVVAAVGAWFAVRAVFSMIGPRRGEALWLTDEHLVHNSERGRERCERARITHVRAMNDAVMVMVNGPIDRQLVPFPWRPGLRWRRRRTAAEFTEHTIWFPTQHVGHTAEQLSTWLSKELGFDERGWPPLKA